jgi:NAD(P)H-flavin reductase
MSVTAVAWPGQPAPRTLAPPERRLAEVARCERLGAYDMLTVRDPIGPTDPQPGQFYMLAAAERWGGGSGERPHLPRAFSFARSRAFPGGNGVQLEFLLEDVGPGTRRLAELSAGDGLWLLGPLGAGFGAPPADRRAILCGGGIGVAPLLALAGALPEHPGGAEAVLGFRSAAYAQAAGLFGSAGAVAGLPVDVTTDDGSVGRAGRVDGALADALAAPGDAVVYACGPPAMLEAVRALCTERGVPAQLALESGMACGYGACFGCVVATREGYLRLCVDGPVLDAALLDTALVPGGGHQG